MPAPLPRPASPLPAAASLVAGRPVFDAHVDAIQRALDLGHDLGVEGPGHFDLARGRRGGLGAVVLVCWVDPAYLPDGAARRAAALLAEIHRLAERRPEEVELVGSGAALARARAGGRTAAVAGIEGGHAIEGSLERLRWFFERGVRVLTLVWNNHLPWIRSCMEADAGGAPEGLSPFGREVVAEMNRLGVLVDLSHAAERAFFDVLAATRQPVVASHSGCRALHDHPRNLTDDQLRALAEAGGVAGIVFHPGFLDAGARREEARVRASDEYRALSGAGETARFLAQSRLLQRRAAPLSAERVADHVLHAVEVAGVEHVGIGSDFDGIQRGPEGLEDASCYGRLAELLLRRGLADEEVRAVLGGNLERVFSAVTAAPSEASRAAIVPAAVPAVEPG